MSRDFTMKKLCVALILAAIRSTYRTHRIPIALDLIPHGVRVTVAPRRGASRALTQLTLALLAAGLDPLP